MKLKKDNLELMLPFAKKSRINLLALVLLVLFIPACQSQKINKAKPEEGSQLIVRMDRTSCFGTCPTYQVEIYENGVVLYEGIRYVEKTGRHYTVLSRKDLAEWKDKLEKANLFGMTDKYPEAYTAPADLPSRIITYYAKGAKKRIVDYGEGAPSVLLQLEEDLDGLVKRTNLHLADK